MQYIILYHMTKSSYILLREYVDPCQGGWDLSFEKQKAVAQISFGYCAGRLTALRIGAYFSNGTP